MRRFRLRPVRRNLPGYHRQSCVSGSRCNGDGGAGRITVSAGAPDAPAADDHPLRHSTPRRRSRRRFVRARRRKGTIMNIVLPDGSTKELADGATVADVAASIGAGLVKAALAGIVNGQAVDLDAPVAEGDSRCHRHRQEPRGLGASAPFDGARHGRRACRPVRRREVRRGTGHRGRLLLRREAATARSRRRTSPPSRPAWPRS